jgi:hypothetical protein
MKIFIYLFSGFLLLFLQNKSMANHIYGAEITYDHISGLSYRISITTYVSYNIMNGDIDWPQLDSVHVSNNVVLSFERDSFTDIENNIRMNYYSREFTYPAPGNYSIYLITPNRHGNIANIPNSFFTPFCVRSDLTINPICPNSSVKFADKPIFYSQKNKIYLHQPAVINPDHDSLLFELDTCLGEYGTPIPGYSFPPGFTIDSISGEISSGGLPDSICMYSLAVKISEWKNGIMCGSVVRDYTITIHPDTLTAYGFISPALQLDTGGNYFQTLNPGDNLSLQIQYGDSSTFPELNVYGEAFSVGNPAAVSINSGTSNTASAQLSWIPDATHSRPYPYIFTFRGSNDIQQTDLTVLVYVNGPKPDSCYTASTIGIDELSDENEFVLFPDPVRSTFRISYNDLGNYSGPITTIEIYNSFGKYYYSSAVDCTSCLVNCASFPPGIYFVKATAGNKIVYKKFIKE